MLRVPLPKLFSQFDPQWCRILLGTNTDPKFDIYNYGCLLCSLAMVCCYYGHDETPATLNEKLKAVGGFTNGGEYVWGSLSKIYPDIHELSVITPEPLTDAQLGEVKAALDAHAPVMVELDYNPKTLAVEEHFSLLVDYDPTDENNFTLADTLGGVLKSLRNYLGWFNESSRKTMQRYTIFSKDGFALPEGLSAPMSQPIQAEATLPQASSGPQAPSSVLPENYSDIVHGSTEWDAVVKAYTPDRLPERTSFADIQPTIDSRVRVETKEVVKEVPAGDGAVDAQKWAQLVDYLELGKTPFDATFEDARRVIAGHKSAVTDYRNKAIEPVKTLARKDVELSNLQSVIGNLQKQVLRGEKLRRAEIDTLIKNVPSFTKLKTQYEATVKELQADYAALQEAHHDLKLQTTEKAVLQALTNPPSAEATSNPVMQLAETMGAAVIRYLHLKW